MSIALITEANPRAMSESHPSFLTAGKWRVLAPDVQSKLSVRRRSSNTESIYCIGDVFEGECQVVILIVEAKNEDSRISVFAERVKQNV